MYKLVIEKTNKEYFFKALKSEKLQKYVLY